MQSYKAQSKVFLLDGHFCLLNKEAVIQPVPFATFASIALKAILLITSEPLLIMERLKARDSIVGYSLEFITTFQEREIEQAQAVNSRLNLSMLIHNSFKPVARAVEFVKEAIRH